MIPPVWIKEDGTQVSCREKLKVLAENHEELAQTLRDVFEDAVLMGVDPAAMRRLLTDMVAELASPVRRGRSRDAGVDDGTLGEKPAS